MDGRHAVHHAGIVDQRGVAGGGEREGAEQAAVGRVHGGRAARDVHAIDEQTGKLIWDFTTKSRVDSSPTLAGDVIWVGSNDGNLYALDLKSGKELWKFTLGGTIVAQPAISGNRLILGSRDGVVYCLKKP